MTSLAYERAAHLIEMARLEEEARQAAGTRAADTDEELRREAQRNTRRAEEREHWINVMLPRIRVGATPQELRRGYY